MTGGDRRHARQSLGRLGEELARRHLETQGYRILASNYRCQAGEVDLIAQDGECLVFVEVRLRRGDEWGTPEESVTRAKQARLVQVAETYLAERENWDADWRIDVVALELDRRGVLQRLEVVRDAVSR